MLDLKIRTQKNAQILEMHSLILLNFDERKLLCVRGTVPSEKIAFKERFI